MSEDQFPLVMSAGGRKMRVTKIPNFTPLPGTVPGWEVDDTHAPASWLKNRGVDLEKFLSPKTVNSEFGRPRAATK